MSSRYAKFNLNRKSVLISLLIIIILALVFLAYLQPAFIVDLANRYVFC